MTTQQIKQALAEESSELDKIQYEDDPTILLEKIKTSVDLGWQFFHASTPPPNERMSTAFKQLKETSGALRVNTLADFHQYKRTLLEHIRSLLAF
ncbi:hypothetical protein [Spirosoma endophyticum]|uniref:Uncharacterized protein n=1 Tax=Spirosoma endophyticum TaxID=662367 RepID=A0A1I2H438_9BACT|nr:hypothetical protein [Spirosoma endophyticum]SFF24905.1 hypothetical protein SAMN05216167_13817 [Spirosoma endophyticum]